MWYSSYAKENKEADGSLTPSDRALVAGGTQGIGAGIALRFALAGASVWIIGRSNERGQEVVERLHQASKEGRRRLGASSSSADDAKAGDCDHAFFQADLSRVSEINRVADAVSQRAGPGGVRWLFETQGGPPTGNADDTPDGIDSAFAVQCLSRYGLAKRLLEAGTVKESVCMIAMPGGGGKKPLDLDDIEMKKNRSRIGLNLPRSGARDSTVLDAVTQSLAEKYPSIAFSHLFPFVVGTNAAANQKFPFPLPQLMGLASYVVPSPTQFAEVPFYLHAHPQGRAILRTGQANLLMPWLSTVSLSGNVTDAGDREAIIKKLDSYGV